MHTSIDPAHEIESLQESQALLSSLIEGTDALIWAVDARDFSLLVFNPALARYGKGRYGLELVKGMALEEFHAPLTFGIWSGLYRRALEEGNFSTEYTTLDGATTLLVSLGILRREGEVFGISVFGKDLTPLKEAEENQRRMEAAMAHSVKMESLGSLAAGIAHDMNNVLGVIQAVGETLHLMRPEDPDLQKALGTLLTANARGRDLLQGLTSFSRKDLRRAESLDVNQLIRDEVDILRHTTFRKVSLELDLDETIPEVIGERSALASALMNLCVNALDAMHGAGRLTLRTRRHGDDMLEMCVEDDGEGMTEEVLLRATEPFFTTKAHGKGTGLGLAMVHSAARAHGGSVEIQSQAGRGTQVTLRLPGLASRGALPPVTRHVPATRKLHILLVDDDEFIQASVPGMMARLGHTLESATSGAEAMERMEKGLEVHLAVIDINMPALDGFETLAALRTLHPGLPAIIITGSLDPAARPRAQAMPHTAFLRKPFSMDEFATCLAELGPGPA